MAIVTASRTGKGMRPQHQGFVLSRDSPQCLGLTGWMPLLGSYDKLERISNKVLTQTGNPVTGYANALGFGRSGSPATQAEASGIGRCAVSASTNSYIRSTTTTYGALTGFTMAIWAGPVASDGDMVCACGSGTAGPRFNYNSVTGILSVTKGSDGATIITDPYGFHNPLWKHFAYTWDGTTNRLYINGVEAVNNTAARDGTGSITRLCVFTNSADGSLNGNTPTGGTGAADMRIYNRPISAKEVYALYDPATRWDLYSQRERQVAYFDMATASRVAKNTRAFPLGLEIGMGWRMPA